MNQAAVEPFATTIEETSLWLKSIGDQAGARDNKDLAWTLLGATLHALRDRLQAETAIHLGAQLPMLVRGLYYEHWHVNKMPARERHKAQFFDHVRNELPVGMELNPEAAVRAVFNVMHENIDPGEIAKLRRQMPTELRELWPA